MVLLTAKARRRSSSRSNRSSATPSISKIKLDFSSLQSLEAASSGMLMFLSHSAKSKNKTLGVANANQQVLAVMHKANLGKVLQIL